MYAVVFEKDKDPVIWDSVSGWPGMLNLTMPLNTHVYFPETKSWHIKTTSEAGHPIVPEDTVPPEYRAFILLVK